MKKFLKSMSLVAVCVFMLCSVAFASDITVKINGESLNFEDVAPQISGESILVPMRAVFEKLGAEVFWESETKTIISSKEDLKVITQIGNTKLFVNNNAVFDLAVAPFIENDRTLIPADAIKNAFGCEINWDKENNVVEILSVSKK